MCHEEKLSPGNPLTVGDILRLHKNNQACMLSIWSKLFQAELLKDPFYWPLMLNAYHGSSWDDHTWYSMQLIQYKWWLHCFGCLVCQWFSFLFLSLTHFFSILHLSAVCKWQLLTRPNDPLGRGSHSFVRAVGRFCTWLNRLQHEGPGYESLYKPVEMRRNLHFLVY